MSDLRYWLPLGFLAAAMLLREWQNQRTIRELLNRLLIKHGVDPLPEAHPLAEAIKELTGEKRDTWPLEDIEAEKMKKRAKVAVTFPVPGMDVLKTMLAKRKE